MAIIELSIIIGYYGNDSSAQPQETSSLVEHLMADQFLSEQKLIEDTLEAVDSISLRNYLKELTKEPHIAGHRRDNELIDYIYRAWTDMGLDNVELAEYDFYLSWPNAVSSAQNHYSFVLTVVFKSGFLFLTSRVIPTKFIFWKKMAAFSSLHTIKKKS